MIQSVYAIITYSYSIQNRTDTPGWFDADNERLPSVHSMLNKINECIKISESGITAFFIVVPFERISIDTEQSIYFMRDCFNNNQSKHVWMIFTKCKRNETVKSILDQLYAQKNRGRKASGLVYNYAQQINEQCFATDTQMDDEKELDELRSIILEKMHGIMETYGMCPDSVFQIAQRNYQNELHRLEQRHHYQQSMTQKKYKRMLTMGTVMGLGFVAAGINGYYKYHSVVSQNSELQQKASQLQNETTELSQQTQQLQTVNAELENANRQKSVYIGVAEATAGALWFAIEPISGAVAIFDGLSRLWKKE